MAIAAPLAVEMAAGSTNRLRGLYGTGTGGVSMLLRDDGAVFHITGLLRTDGRYLCANGLHAVAVVQGSNNN